MTLTNLRRDEAFQKDFKLICEGKEFLVQKAILSASSPYFQQYFKKYSSATTLQLNFLNSKILEMVLTFIYEGHVDLTKEPLPILLDVVAASRTFRIFLLKSQCLQLIEESLSPQILLSEWRAIEKSDSEELKDAYWQHFHIQNLKQARSFLSLTVQQMSSLLNRIFNKFGDMKIILSAIFLWINFDLSTRKASLNDLLKALDFGKFSKAQLREFSKNPLFHGNLYFYQQITAVLLKEDELQEQVPELVIKTKESNNISKHLLCYNMEKFNTVFEYNLNSKTWRETDNEEMIRAFSAVKFPTVCGFDQYIYFFGGLARDRTALKECQLLDLSQNQLFQISPMRESRIHAKALKINDFIYIFGGHPNKKKNEWITNERYNLKTQLWDTVPTLSCKEHNPRHILVTCVNELVCLVGKTNLFWFDPQKNEWQKGKRIPLKSPSTADSLIHYDNKIFLLKFHRNSAHVDLEIVCLDLITKAWETFSVPSAELSDRIDIESISEADKFLLQFEKECYLYTPPDTLNHLSLPFHKPGLIVIEK